ncbi:MAG: helix-turn-helix domain-containing protein [Lachnospiraceae bacterium]|nr:helix-turn-helix domain-containing protein [Lachnospiraceae bacterium]
MLAYSEKLKNANIWEADLKTGRPVVRTVIRNDFQLDQEYLEGLSERKTVLFSANQRGYQILYRNLYNEKRYIGRVLVEEIVNLIQPGDYDVMEYLADFIQETITLKGLTRGDYDGQLDQDIRQILNGQIPDNQNLLRMMEQKEWRQEDVYRCLKLIPNQMEAYLVSNTAIVDRLHVLLPACYTLLYEESAVVIVNMTRIDKTIKEIVTGLAVFLRDNLMKLGISSEYSGFFRLQNGYKQASIALEMGKRSGSMYWYYYFENYLVDYVRDTMTREMPVDFLISEAMNTLKQYDADNHTELFHTLKVYLRLERNLLQTAKKLYIHRSTLSYRIERIQNITGIDLEDEKERLKLLLSFALEEQIGT